MIWRVLVRPEAEEDLLDAATWYESRVEGLGSQFIEEILGLLDSLAINPQLAARRHPNKNIRWLYPNRFPYRVVCELLEEDQTVIVAAVLHGARHDRHWRGRMRRDS